MNLICTNLNNIKLVLLENNPLENIEHTTSIEAVFAKGAYFDREMLDAMLESVKQANQGSKQLSHERNEKI